MTPAEKIEAFLDERPGITDGSRRTYFSNLKRFYVWCRNNAVDHREIRRRHLAAYARTFDHCSDLTRYNSFNILKHHFAWLEQNGLGLNVLKGDSLAKQPRNTNEFRKLPLSSNELRLLMAQPRTSNIVGARDAALMALLAFNGLRVIEATRATFGDLTSDGNGLFVQRKGSKTASELIRLPDFVQQCLNEYLVMRSNLNNQSPLIAPHGQRNKTYDHLHPSTAGKIVKTYMRQIGLNGKMYTAHSLRHTTAAMLLRSGASPYDLQRYLGHKNFQTSQIYLSAYQKEQLYASNLGEKLVKNVFNSD